MPGTRVPFFAHSGQIPLSIITFFSCGLSFWLTVRFCGNLAPGHAAAELLAIGVTWELAKLTFGTLGSHRIKRGDTSQSASGYALLGVSLVLAVGSIVASLAFLMQTDQHVSQEALQASQQALHASEAYERETATLRALDGEIKELTSLAQQYRERGLLTQGMRSMQRAAVLRQERQAQVQALSKQDEVAIINHGAAGGGFSLLGASPNGRLAAQVVLAVMLEVVSMIALSLLCGSGTKPAMGGSASSGTPTDKVVRLKVASPRIASDAGLHRAASGGTHGDSDADVPRTLLQRIACDAGAPRITSDAGLHGSAWSDALRHSDADRRSDDIHAHGGSTRLHRIDASAAALCIASDAAPLRTASSHAQRMANTSGSPAGPHGIAPASAAICIASDAVAHRCSPQQMGLGAVPNPAPQPATKHRVRDAQRLCHLYVQAKELVRTAQLRPCYREMQRALGASQQVVQRFLRSLVAEGVLCRRGTGYVLASRLDMHGGAV